jgi:hypothetical protein
MNELLCYIVSLSTPIYYTIFLMLSNSSALTFCLQTVEEKARTYSNTSYKRVEFMKTKEEVMNWNTEREGHVSRGDKRGTHVRAVNREKHDELAVTGPMAVSSHYRA